MTVDTASTVVRYDFRIPSACKTALAQQRADEENSYTDTVLAVLSGRRKQLTTGMNDYDASPLPSIRLFITAETKADWTEAARAENLDLNAWLCREIFGYHPSVIRRSRTLEADPTRILFRLHGSNVSDFLATYAADPLLRDHFSVHGAARELVMDCKAIENVSAPQRGGQSLIVAFSLDGTRQRIFNETRNESPVLRYLSDHEAARMLLIGGVTAWRQRFLS